jgi:hypothetical protein
VALSADDEMVHRRSQDAHVVLTEISSLAMVHASTFTVSKGPALAESTVSFPLLSDGAKEGNLLGVLFCKAYRVRVYGLIGAKFGFEFHRTPD